MNIQSELAHQQSLDHPTARSLFQSTGLDDEPPGLQLWFWRSVALIAAALGGLGIILWIAANWQSMDRIGHFALLQTFTVLCCLGAWRWPAVRVPLGLLSMLGIGALFAYFGQTYQTGADPWQLFALWAALALPLCLAIRSDVLWTPWAIVAMTAVMLWLHAHASGGWRLDSATWDFAFAAQTVALLLTALLSPAAPRFIGAGIWAHRSTGTLAVFMISTLAIEGLFGSTVSVHYGMGIALLVAFAALLAMRKYFDIYLLSAIGLALDTLLIAGLTVQMFRQNAGFSAMVLVIGLVAAGLLAASVSCILHLSRKYGAGASNKEAA